MAKALAVIRSPNTTEYALRNHCNFMQCFLAVITVRVACAFRRKIYLALYCGGARNNDFYDVLFLNIHFFLFATLIQVQAET